MLRFLTAGESHGPALVTVVEGMPAGLFLTAEHINARLVKRQAGFGRGGRMAIEKDTARILSGVRGGFTLGSPVAVLVENRDFANWREVMDPAPSDSAPAGPVTRPRPGHADLAGALKYRHRDIRNVLERASARETAARVAAGSIAARLLEELGVKIAGLVLQVGGVKAQSVPAEGAGLEDALLRSRLWCPDPAAEEKMLAAIEEAAACGDTLGGVFEVRACGLPPGLGSYAQWDRRLDGRLAGAVMSVQGVKGVEIGLGFAAAGLPGSQVHDEIRYEEGRGFFRTTNRAGGLEGGVTNGEVLVVRAAMKPIPTLRKPLASVDIQTKEAAEALAERSDVCAVPSACVVAEAAVAWELACAFVEKFGGDSLAEMKENLHNYKLYLEKF